MKIRIGLIAILAASLIAASTGFVKESASKMKPTVTSPKVGLKLTMRTLWEDHITYTRNYIISALADLPDTNAVANRLLKNQDDIGDAVKPYYGDDAGKKLTALLREHIMIAAQVVKAAKGGDKNQLAAAQTKWSSNSKEMAVFWSGANPELSQKTLEEMLQKHLDLATAEVVGRLSKDWAKDIDSYDEGHRHMMLFSDILSNGIIKQFPAKFKKDK